MIARINKFLQDQLNTEVYADNRLAEAIKYSVLGPGKRLRAQLVYAVAVDCNLALDAADIIAATVELMHAYSLVHDDLPAMDDDDFRRGQPSCHRKFDEAIAILVGDALQSMAFNWLIEKSNYTSEQKINLIKILSRAVGPAGMVGGQALELTTMLNSKNNLCAADLNTKIHRLKTGALIEAAVRMPLVLSQLNAAELDSMHNFAADLGLGFQIRDDLLDAQSDTENQANVAASQSSSTAIKMLNTLQDQALENLNNISLPMNECRKLASAFFSIED